MAGDAEFDVDAPLDGPEWDAPVDGPELDGASEVDVAPDAGAAVLLELVDSFFFRPGHHES